jgi:hypothetical protein
VNVLRTASCCSHRYRYKPNGYKSPMSVVVVCCVVVVVVVVVGNEMSLMEDGWWVLVG